MSLTVRLSFGAWSELFSRRMGAFSERSAIPVLCLLYFPPNTLWIRNLLHTSGSRKFISHFCHNDHFLLERYGNHHKNIKSCIYRGYLCLLIDRIPVLCYPTVRQLSNCIADGRRKYADKGNYPIYHANQDTWEFIFDHHARLGVCDGMCKGLLAEGDLIWGGATPSSGMRKKSTVSGSVFMTIGAAPDLRSI